MSKCSICSSTLSFTLHDLCWIRQFKRLTLGAHILLFLLTFALLAADDRVQIQGSSSQPYELVTACPTYDPGLAANTSAAQAFADWRRGNELSSMEDGMMGTALGHPARDGEAKEWYCKAAAEGSALAAYSIGLLYQKGFTLPPTQTPGGIQSNYVQSNHAIAFYWFKIAADKHYTAAMIKVAYYYCAGEIMYKGSGVQQDLAKSLKLVTDAAELNDTEAQTYLANAYAEGTNSYSDRYFPIVRVPQSTELALKWGLKSALTLASNAGVCQKNYAALVDNLPEAARHRPVTKVVLSVSRHDSERVCTVYMGAARDEDESLLGGLQTLFGGGLVSSWNFTVYDVPGSSQPYIRRETLAEATDEGAIKLSEAVQALLRNSKQ